MAHGVRAPYYNIVSVYGDEGTEYMAIVTYHNSNTEARSTLWTTRKDQAYQFESLTAAANTIEEKELVNEFLIDEIKIVEMHDSAE